jgi:hypothetical protein
MAEQEISMYSVSQHNFILQVKPTVSASDGDDYEANHNSVSGKCLHLLWWLEISNLTNLVLHNTVRSESRCAFTQGVGSDVHER